MSSSHSALRRTLRAVLMIGSVAVLMLSMSVGTALGWVRPVLQANCAPDSQHLAWNINLAREADYYIQFSWRSDFGQTWEVNFQRSGDHAFVTNRDGSTLYARWKSDKAKSTSSAANVDLCFVPTPTPTPTPKPTPTPTPTPTVPPTVTPTPTARPSTPATTPNATPTPRENELPGNPTPPVVTLPDTAVPVRLVPSQIVAVLPISVLLMSLATLALAMRQRR